jgi:outer membrane protein assembly factor BamB
LNPSAPVQIVSDAPGARASPIVVGDKVYFGTVTNQVLAYTKTGEREWTFGTENWISTTPTFGCDTVFVTGHQFTYALDAATGRKLWRADIGHPRASPVLIDDTLYACSTTGVYALSVADGHKKWTHSQEGPLYQGLAASDDHIFVSAGSNASGALCALDRSSGELLWKYNTSSSVYTSPVVSGDIVCVVDRLGTLQALNARNGEVIWRAFGLGNDSPAPAVTGDTVYVSPGDQIEFRAFNLENGSIRWSFETGKSWTPPIVAGQTILVPTANNGIYGLRQGDQRWHAKEPTVGSALAIADNDLFYTSDGGSVRRLGK